MTFLNPPSLRVVFLICHVTAIGAEYRLTLGSEFTLSSSRFSNTAERLPP